MKNFRARFAKTCVAILLVSSAFAAIQSARADSADSDNVATPTWELSRRLVRVSECVREVSLLDEYYVTTTFEVQKLTLSMESPSTFVSTMRFFMSASPIFDISEPQISYKDSYLTFSKTSRASALDSCIAMRELLLKRIK